MLFDWSIAVFKQVQMHDIM